MELRLKTKTSVFFLHGAIILLATELVNLANDDGTSRPSCMLLDSKKQGSVEEAAIVLV